MGNRISIQFTGYFAGKITILRPGKCKIAGAEHININKLVNIKY
jgi:hypothetical protein